MTAIDFANSYMTWFGSGNHARIQLDAACTIVDEQAGTEGELLPDCTLSLRALLHG